MKQNRFYLPTALLISLALILAYCKPKTGIDRIAPNFAQLNEECKEYSEGYFERMNYQISNYYVVRFVKSKDLNRDGHLDSLAVLTPLNLWPEPEVCKRSSIDLTENRLLLINLMSREGKILKKFKYDNVLTSEPSTKPRPRAEYPNVGNPNYPGFILEQDYGQGSYFKYEIYVDYSKEIDDFEIDSIVFRRKSMGNPLPEQVAKYPIKTRPFYLKDYQRSIVEPYINGYWP